MIINETLNVQLSDREGFNKNEDFIEILYKAWTLD